MSADVLQMPVVLRVSVGSKYRRAALAGLVGADGAHTGPEGHIPATPYDAKGLMNAALAGSDPVVFFESQRLYDMGEQFHEGGVPRATTRSR